MSNKCSGLFGRLFGHKFQPRYDSNETYPEGTIEGLRTNVDRVLAQYPMAAMDSLSEVAEAYRCMDQNFVRYVQDVCVRCGEVRERPVEIGEQLVVTERAEKRSVTRDDEEEVLPVNPPADPKPTGLTVEKAAEQMKPKVVAAVVQAPAPKIVVVPGTPGGLKPSVAQPNPVKAVPGRGPK